MGWGSDFIAALSQSSIVPIYELEFLDLPNSFSGGFTLNGHSGQARIGDSSPRVYGTSVIPGRWNVSFGGFDVDIVGDLRPYSARMSKGIFAVLRCAIRGSGGTSPFEIIGYGQLYAISGGRETFTLRFRDLLSAFQTSSSSVIIGSVHDTDRTYPEFRMFTNAGRSAQLTSSWNGSDLFLDVDNVTFFEKQSTVNGVLKAENIASGQSFYLQWSGITVTSAPAGRITLASAVAAYPSANASGALSTGITNSKITNCTRLVGHPQSILHKILISTGDNNPAGAGSHGPNDLYPLTWSAGGGFDPDIYDSADAKTMLEYVRIQSGGNYQWELIIDSAPSDGLRYLTNLSSKTGQWPVWRQGAVSWRAAIDPTGIRCFQQPIIATSLYDYDIISISKHDWYSGDVNQVYSSLRTVNTKDWASGAYSSASSATTITVNEVQALPAGATKEIDLSLIYRNGPPTYNPSDMASSDRTRMKGWDGYIHEKLVLRTKLKYAVLCAGDIIEVTSAFIYGRDEGPGATYATKRAMVTGVDFAISDQSCTLTLAVLPERYL